MPVLTFVFCRLVLDFFCFLLLKKVVRISGAPSSSVAVAVAVAVDAINVIDDIERTSACCHSFMNDDLVGILRRRF